MEWMERITFLLWVIAFSVYAHSTSDRVRSIEMKVDKSTQEIRDLGGFHGHDWHKRQCYSCGIERPEQQGAVIWSPDGQQWVCELCAKGLTPQRVID